MHIPIGAPKKIQEYKRKKNTCSLRREEGVPSKAGLISRSFLVQFISSVKIPPKQKPDLRLF